MAVSESVKKHYKTMGSGKKKRRTGRNTAARIYLAKEINKVLRREVSPKRVEQFIDKVIEMAAGGKSAMAVALLKRLNKEFSVKISDGIVRLGTPPAVGVMNDLNSEIPTATTSGSRRISGANGVFTGTAHKIKFHSGPPPGKWLRTIAKQNGMIKRKIFDTRELYSFDDTNRLQYIKDCGFNRKRQLCIDEDNFGFNVGTLGSITNISETTMSSSTISEMRIYGAVHSLISKATITNLNSFIPVNVGLHLMSLEQGDSSAKNEFNRGINDTITTQEDGCMPLYYQHTAKVTDDLLGAMVEVDYRTPGVFTADIFKDAARRIASKRVKLYAGDRIDLEYTHTTGSGVRLDVLFGNIAAGAVNSVAAPVTYFLVVEFNGEIVDIEAVSNGAVTKGTCPSSLQFEFEKYAVTIPQSQDVITGRTSNIFDNSNVAIRTFTRQEVGTEARIQNLPYSDMNSTFIVPFVTDKLPETAERK